jgi:chemotaxis protein methyltransferase CheR
MRNMDLTDKEFTQFQRFIFDTTGITMSAAKRALIGGRLAKRLPQHGCTTFSDYFRVLDSGTDKDEVQIAINLLTTNETYFFREPKHFAFLREQALAARGGRPLRVWSAASSSGEEAYSIAMVLADCLPDMAWEVVGSDISTRVLERARAGHYSLERTEHIPPSYLQRFCLKGLDHEAGTMLVARSLRSKVQFVQVNLNERLPQLGQFDIVFLRNVMIYFNGETKRQVVERVLSTLRPGGYLCIGHSESLNDIGADVHALAPAIFQKGGAR